MASIVRVFLVITIVLAAIVAVQNAALARKDSSLKISPDEAYILLDQLLELSEKKRDVKDQLAEYKKWESLYIKYSRAENPTELDIKIFFMMVFIANERYKAHTLEESAKDILLIYRKNPKRFLKVLKENPFLIPSACDRLRDSYDLYGRPGKKDFIKNNTALLLESLGEKLGRQCIAKLLFVYESKVPN